MSRQDTAGRSAATMLLLLLAGCGGGGGGSSTPPPPAKTYTVGGAVSGLAAGGSVTLADNGGDLLTVQASGAFVFATPVTQGGSYAVTVTKQPNGQTCAVSSGSGSQLSANVSGVAVACTDRPLYAYVVNNGDNTISQYAVDSTGQLSALSPATVPTGASPQSVTVDPSHHYVYVTNLNDNSVSQFVIQSNGTLQPNSPATITAGQGPWAVTINPSGSLAYVVNSIDNTISEFALSANGTLAATSVAPVATGTTPWNMTLSPNGKYAYVANHGTAAPGGMTMSQYSVDGATGELKPLVPPTVPTAFSYPGGVTVDPTSSYAYLANIRGNSISQFAIAADGTLSNLSPASVPTGTEPVFLAFDPTGKYAYVANYTVDFSSAQGTVSQYAVGAGGQLTPLATPTVPAAIGPGWIAFDAFGKFAFVVNLGNGTLPGTVTEYAIGTDGALTPLGNVLTGKSAFMIATSY